MSALENAGRVAELEGAAVAVLGLAEVLAVAAKDMGLVVPSSAIRDAAGTLQDAALAVRREALDMMRAPGSPGAPGEATALANEIDRTAAAVLDGRQRADDPALRVRVCEHVVPCARVARQLAGSLAAGGVSVPRLVSMVEAAEAMEQAAAVLASGRWPVPARPELSLEDVRQAGAGGEDMLIGHLGWSEEEGGTP